MRRATTLAIGCLTLACASGPAPTDHFYRLEAAAPSREVERPALSGGIRVNRLRAESMTDGTHLLLRNEATPSEVVRLDYHHWTDAPTLMLRDQLVRYLQRTGVADPVLTPAVRGSVDYTLSGRLLQLERWVASGRERVDLEVELTLLRESDRSLVLHRSYAESEPLEESGVAAAVDAWNRALTRLLDRFVVDLQSGTASGLAMRNAWPR